MGKRNRTGRIIEIRDQIILEMKSELILIAEILENFEINSSKFCDKFDEDIRNWPPIVEKRRVIMRLRNRLNYFLDQGWDVNDLISKDYKEAKKNLHEILYEWLPEFLERPVTEFIIVNRIPSMIATGFGDRQIDDSELRTDLAKHCRELANF